ncbi:hypothetical protein IFT73_14405 [Aeromicrobium sp. CFBP 8757]|uniref:hypothetical protein n=1 Tax=Aeromicrobium sp. CFBP 8757 TaxID=2775288 RepID=UPI00177F5FD0|nr:hypothetical protein [Aeromicrobium sp. CFBP 8757]MBD8608046.1 hypothetical protein [Aeromicrobium sp. CFBP 8757]
MRRPVVPAWAERAVNPALVLVQVAVVGVGLWSWWGWAGLLIGPPLIAALWMLWPHDVADDEGCLRCRHASIHHRGCCQACLRDVEAGRATSVTPCGRFRRWSPRNRWSELRAGDDRLAAARRLVRAS